VSVPTPPMLDQLAKQAANRLLDYFPVSIRISPAQRTEFVGFIRGGMEAATQAQREQVKGLESVLVEKAAVLAAVQAVANGESVDDFAESFAVVRAVADLLQTAEAQLITQREQIAQLKDFVQELADEPCMYGDNCPTFGTRHGTCLHCKARGALVPRGEP
jgi:hypothetical protein